MIDLSAIPPELTAFDMDQGTDAWHEIRLGIPTMSEADVIARTKGRGPNGRSLTRDTLLRQKAGEVITGQPTYSYTNDHMKRGHLLEAEARSRFAFEHNVQLVQVGFMRRGRMGASPDSLIVPGADGKRGGLEIKTRLAELQIELLLGPHEIPSENLPQLHGQMMVGLLDYVVYVSYCPGLPLFVVRLDRNESACAALSIAVSQFNRDLDEMIARIVAL